MINHKGTDCPYKPILCQEGFCQECQIYKDYLGHLKTMGRLANMTPQWLIDQEREDKND